MKKISLGVLALVGLLVISGCASKNVDTKNRAGKQRQAFDVSQWKDKMTEKTAADLVVGLQVMAMGTVNADQSLTAQMIMIGDMGMFANRPNQADTVVSGATEGSGQQPQRGNFANLSDEERQKLRSRIGPEAQGGAMGGRGQSNRVVGEILKKDEQSITVKLVDGGSKVVLITSKTFIGEAKPQAEVAKPVEQPKPTDQAQPSAVPAVEVPKTN